MIDQFEKLPEIAETLLDYKNEVVFHELENKYITPCYSTFVPEYVYFLNGAYYAFQEQQKKIDAVLRFVDGYDSIDIENSVNLRDCVNEIEELLK